VVSPSDETLRTYEAEADRYRANTPPSVPDVQRFLDRLSPLVPGGTILEVGSGPGWDASYLEANGHVVVRSDGAQAFVDMLAAEGHPARLLDIRRDPLGGPYDAIVANAVLLHLSSDELEAFLVRARDSVPNGYLAFTLKEGDGDAWTSAKLDRPRHFTYWRVEPLRALLEQTGWSTESVDRVTSDSQPWLMVIARSSDP